MHTGGSNIPGKEVLGENLLNEETWIHSFQSIRPAQCVSMCTSSIACYSSISQTSINKSNL